MASTIIFTPYAENNTHMAFTSLPSSSFPFKQPARLLDNLPSGLLEHLTTPVRLLGNLTTVVPARPIGNLDSETSPKLLGTFTTETPVGQLEKLITVAPARLIESLVTEASPKLLGNFTTETPVRLLEKLTTVAPARLIENLVLETSPKLLGNFTTKAPVKLLENLTTEAPAELFENLNTETSVRLLGNLTTESPTRLLDSLITETPTWLLDNITSNQTEIPTKEPIEIPFYFKFRHEPWVIPLLTICAINIAAILVFEVYVLYKSCGSRRHLLMGQILLFGLFLCSLLGLAYVPEPHWLFCGITRAGLGVVYSMIFSALLVKCVFLLKLHNGVYLNASSQGLLLFFAIAVEVTIVTQWLVYDPPTTIPSPDFNYASRICSKSPLDKIEYLGYIMFLMLLVIIASIRARNLRENNREALYVGIAIGISLVIWVAWISVALVFDRRYDAAAESLGLVCTATAVFLLIFVPKAVQLARRRNDRLNGSSAGSRSVLNTPSFMHLQPHAVIPVGGQDTVVKQTNVNADYCRGYPSRMWRYDYPSFHQMEPSVSDSLKKSNFSSSNSRIC